MKIRTLFVLKPVESNDFFDFRIWALQQRDERVLLDLGAPSRGSQIERGFSTTFHIEHPQESMLEFLKRVRSLKSEHTTVFGVPRLNRRPELQAKYLLFGLLASFDLYALHFVDGVRLYSRGYLLKGGLFVQFFLYLKRLVIRYATRKCQWLVFLPFSPVAYYLGKILNDRCNGLNKTILDSPSPYDREEFNGDKGPNTR